MPRGVHIGDEGLWSEIHVQVTWHLFGRHGDKRFGFPAVEYGFR